LDDKIGALAGAINRFFAESGPDLLGLAEIATERIVLNLANRLNGAYVHVWEPAGQGVNTGLALLARTAVFSRLQHVTGYRPSTFARPRWLVVRCNLNHVAEPFFTVVNHWKSRMPSGPQSVPDAADRVETAKRLGDFLAGQQRDTCAIVVGDFNAEPFERPFLHTALRSRRTFSNALWVCATSAHLYNTAWKFLCEPAPWEDARMQGYMEPRPKTTHGRNAPAVFDQLLVSGRALRKGPLQLRESTVEYFCDHVTSERNARGRLIPRRWHWLQPGQHSGASDHFPLLAAFDT